MLDFFGFILFLFLSHFKCCSSQDEEVSCVHLERCVLPCRFKTEQPDVTIKWTKTNGGLTVHSFRRGQNQDLDQYPDYSGRTSLFEEEFNTGNASLLFRQVTVQDHGRYLCWANRQVTYVNMKVFAPVSDVLLEEDGERLKCESKDIFPKPSVSWSPPSDHSPSVTASESGLFSVLSSVPLTQRPPLEYSCNVSTERSWRSATYRRTAQACVSGYETTLRCADYNSTVKSLVWVFNHTQTICRRTGDHVIYSPDWKPFVKKVLDSGNLTLKKLIPDQRGLYSCILITDTETYVSSTALQILPQPDHDFYIWSVICVILGVCLIDVLVALMLLIYSPIAERKRYSGASKH